MLRVAVVLEDPSKAASQRLHLQSVEVGRDYGPQIEVISGLTGSEFVVANPGDDVDEGVEVRVLPAEAETPQGRGRKTAGAKSR